MGRGAQLHCDQLWETREGEDDRRGDEEERELTGVGLDDT